MSKQVNARHGGELVVLGVDSVCPVTEHRGWGTGCETLRRTLEGYCCGDCGLVYAKPELHEKQEAKESFAICRCETLQEVIAWFMDECHGYECPINSYKCIQCSRHYKTPKTAPLPQQMSEAGKGYALFFHSVEMSRRREKVARIKDAVRRLQADLEEFTEVERAELLKPLQTQN